MGKKNLHELSNDTLKRYIKKASGDVLSYSYASRDAQARAMDASQSPDTAGQYFTSQMKKMMKYGRKAGNRVDGINRAVDKLKEDTVEEGKRLYALYHPGNDSIHEGLFNLFESMTDEQHQELEAYLMSKLNETEELIRSIIDQRPNDTRELFSDILKSKIADNLDAYKEVYANEMFGGGEKEEDEDETVSDQDVAEVEEYLSNLTDDELAELIQDFENDPEFNVGDEDVSDAGVVDDTDLPSGDDTELAEAELNELSKEKLNDYRIKASKSADNARKSGDKKTFQKRDDGQYLAKKKLEKKGGRA